MTKKEKKELQMRENRKSGKYKKLNLFTGILFGMYLTVSVYLIYNLYRLSGVETVIRYIIMFLLAFFDVFLLIKYFKMRFRPLLKKYILFILGTIILGAGQFFIGYTINQGLNVVENISIKKYKTYSTSIVALKGGNVTDIKDLTSENKIGRVADKNDIENYQLSKYLMKKDNINDKQIEDYDDPITMLYDLYDRKIDAAFIAGGYVDIYKGMEKFANIQEEVIELDKYSKKMKVKKNSMNLASTKAQTEPFTILLMGVDSTAEDLSAASGLGDSLMLITFNPKTLNATILSIPRDTFVPITCYRNAKSKITHAASGGDKCMINTIQNAFDVNIDYYAKINFRGLIKLVDALGGVDVDVPYAFCETGENRSFKNTVFVEKGMQHLDGRQALALSRNRKTVAWCGPAWNQGTRNDFVRGQNQQLVISAILNKTKNMENIGQFYAVLDAVGNSMTTNMDRKQILSFYNVFKNVILNSKDLTDGNDIINLQKMYLNGSGGTYMDGIMNMPLYEYIPSSQSMNAIINAMKVNLELKEEKPAKKFSFSADEEYEQKVIGKDLYGGVEKVPTGSNTTDTTSSCGENEELGADKKTCVCKWGYSRKDGKCQKDDEEEINICGSNSTYNKTKQICECDSGYEKNSSGTCVKKESEKKCDSPYELGADKTTCVCPTWNGYKESNGKCEKEEIVKCEGGTVVSGSCTCPSGYTGASTGVCTLDINPQDPNEGD